MPIKTTQWLNSYTLLCRASHASLWASVSLCAMRGVALMISKGPSGSDGQD